jgi:hypothetical protein
MRAQVVVATALAAAFAAVAAFAPASLPPSLPLRTLPSPRPTSVLYIEGIFDESYNASTMLNDAKQVAQSGFDTVILAFIHVHPTTPPPCPGFPLFPNLVFNNVCFNETELKPIIDALRSPTSSVERVLISIGGADCESDFDALAANWSTLSPQLLAVAHTLGVDGFDIDLEVDPILYIDVLDKIVSLAVRANLLVTAVPADSDDAFLILVRNHATERQPGNTSGVSWLLLQTYGGAGEEWITSWSKNLTGVVPDPVAFLTPGAEVSQTFGPKDFARRLQTLKNKSPASNVTSAFVWDYRLIKYFMTGMPGNLTLWQTEMRRAATGA